MLSDLLWRLRIRNRFALAWWAFRNPDNLTMLRFEMEREFEARRQPLPYTLKWWIDRFLDIPVR